LFETRILGALPWVNMTLNLKMKSVIELNRLKHIPKIGREGVKSSCWRCNWCLIPDGCAYHSKIRLVGQPTHHAWQKNL